MKFTEIFEQVRKDVQEPPSVDVICIVYNHAEYLRQALDSMLSQKTAFPYKILVHDDCSTDNSAEIISEYAEIYPDKVIPFYEEKNLYQQHIGVLTHVRQYIKAKYVAHCEGDDYWIDDCKLQKQVDYMENHSDCSAVYSNILPVDKHGNYNEDLRHCYVYLPEGDYTLQEIKNVHLKTQTATLLGRNYSKYLSDEDYKTYCRCCSNGDVKALLVYGYMGRVHYLSDVLAAHRRVPEGGDSFTARVARMTHVQRLVHDYQHILGRAEFKKIFFDDESYIFNRLLLIRMKIIKAMLIDNTVESKEAYRGMKQIIDIPWYAYILFFPYFFGKCALKGIRMISALDIVSARRHTQNRTEQNRTEQNRTEQNGRSLPTLYALPLASRNFNEVRLFILRTSIC